MEWIAITEKEPTETGWVFITDGTNVNICYYVPLVHTFVPDEAGNYFGPGKHVPQGSHWGTRQEVTGRWIAPGEERSWAVFDGSITPHPGLMDYRV